MLNILLKTSPAFLKSLSAFMEIICSLLLRVAVGTWAL